MKKAVVGLIAAAALFGLSARSEAVSFTFAQFTQANGAVPGFNWSGTTFSQVGTGLPVNFSFSSYLGGLQGGITPADVPLNGIVPATLTITAAAFGPALPSIPPGSAVQPLTGLTFTFTGTSGALAGKNLLTGTEVIPNAASLSGTIGGNSAVTLITDETLLNTLNYTSAVILIPPVELQEAASFSLSGVNPPFTLVGTTISPFTASGTGTFSAPTTAAVPEPGILTLLAAIGVSSSLLVVRRRRVA